ncbi:MAG: hypothetical protein IT211_15795 [Armatimonadetes bacterium]|nr:hypothetical protein [Armatimonadota bacterium]
MNRGFRGFQWIVVVVAFAIGVLLPEAAQAQPRDVAVVTITAAPFDPALSVWEANPSRVQIRLTNNNADGLTYLARMSARLANVDGTVELTTKPDFAPAIFELAPGVAETKNALSIGVFNLNNADVNGSAAAQVISTGRLPEGTYTLCVDVFEASDGFPLSNSGGTSCATFTIVLPAPAAPTLPVCGTTITPSQPQNVNFQWLTPTVPGAQLRYDLLVVAVPNGQTPEQAITTATPLFEQKNLTTSSFLYGIAQPALQVGTTYAWRVRTSDANGAVVFSNGGQSEVCSFTYGDNTPVEGAAPLAPVCGSTVLPAQPQNVMFQWSTPPAPGAQLRYDLLLVAVPNGQTPEQAITTATPLFEQKNLTTSSFPYGIAQPALQVGTTYAWRVRTTDANGLVTFINSGQSEVCSFIYGNLVEGGRPLVPVCGASITPTSPQNVMFQWSTPTAPGGQIRYDLLLVAVPSGQTPEQAITTATPLFEQKNLTVNNFAYGIAQPALQVGTTYAWRVRTFDASGTMAFINGGQSEVCSFTYGDNTPVEGAAPLAPVCGATVTPTQPQNVNFQWLTPTAPGAQLRYDLLLVPVPNGQTPEQAITTATPLFEQKNLTVNSFPYGIAQPTLQIGVTYAWRVRTSDANGLVTFINGGQSEVCSFTYGAAVAGAAPIVPACGITITPTQPRNVGFQWSLPTAPGAQLRYDLVVVPVPSGQTPEQAIATATPPFFFEQKNLTTPNFQYGIAQPALKIGTTYAWRIRTSDAANVATFTNNGESEVCSFTYGDDSPVQGASPLVPVCGATITVAPAQLQMVSFQWTLPTAPGAQVRYDLVMAPVGQGQTPEQAIAGAAASSLFEQKNLTAPSFLYGAGHPRLQVGTTYAWQVRTFDALGEVTFINDGRSEVCSFTYGEQSIGAYEVAKPDGPPCAETVNETAIQSFQMYWIPSTAPNVRYDLVVTPVEAGKSPDEAILTATTPMFLEATNLQAPSYFYGTLSPKLTVGTTYAWRVRTVDNTGVIQFPNDGWSEVCSFTYGTPEKEESAADCAKPILAITFPKSNAVPIPYRNVPIIVRYSPLCAVMKEFNSTLNVMKGGGQIAQRVRSYTFQETLYEKERNAANGKAPTTAVLYSQANNNRYTPFLLGSAGDAWSLPADSLEWSAQVTLKPQDGTGWVLPVGGKFKVGLTSPLLQAPVPNAQVNGDVKFTFQTAQPATAAQVLPSEGVVWSAEKSRGLLGDSIGKVQEIWMIEVSPTPFTGNYTVIKSKIGKLVANIPLSNTASATAALSQVYKTITDSMPLEQGGYYWRAKWLTNNDTSRLLRSMVPSDTAAYAWSEVRPLTVTSNAASIAQCLNIAPSSPINGGDWTASLRPAFAVKITPTINTAKVTGGRIELWKLATEQEKQNPSVKTATRPDTAFSFTGAAGLKARPDTATIDLAFLNTQGFVGEANATYAWRFTLHYVGNGSTIRNDLVACNRDTATSIVGTFRINGQMPTVDPATCAYLTAETPKFDSKITAPTVAFSLKATPAIDSNGIESIQLKVWRRRSTLGVVESAASASARIPDFTQTLTKSNFTNTYATGDFTSLLTLKGTTFVPKMDSSYFWQAVITRATGKPLLASGASCTAPTVASAVSTFRYDTTAVLANANCPDNCLLPEPVNKTLGTTAFVMGDSIRVGQFGMTLTAVTSGAPGDLTGEGRIRIPFMGGISVAVEFTGLKVNNARQVFFGEVKGKQAPDVTLPAEALSTVGAGEWTQQGITAAYGVATQATRLIKNLASKEGAMLPIGLDAATQTGESGDAAEASAITFGITTMSFTPTGATLAAAVKIPLPVLGTNGGVGFGARNLCFTPTGFSGAKREFYLASDVGYTEPGKSWSFKVKGGQATPGDSGTYITWDCKGIQTVSVGLQAQLPRAWVLPITAAGEVDENESNLVTARFAFTWRRGVPATTTTPTAPATTPTTPTSTLSPTQPGPGLVQRVTRTVGGFNLMLVGSIDRFAPANAPDAHAEIGSIALDFSTTENPPGMNFPEGYAGAMDKTWRGFYLANGSLRLPNAFTNRKNSSEAISIGIKYLMIDQTGISCNAAAHKLLPISEGSAGGWGISIDTAAIEVVSNSPKSFSVAGAIQLPIADTTINYKASIAYPAVSINRPAGTTSPATPTTPVGATTPTPPAGSGAATKVRLPKITLSLSNLSAIPMNLWVARARLDNVTVTLEKKSVTPTTRPGATTPTSPTRPASTSSTTSPASGQQLKWVATLDLSAGIAFGKGRAGSGETEANKPPKFALDIAVQNFKVQSVQPYVLNSGTWLINGTTVAGGSSGTGVAADPSATTTTTTTATAAPEPQPEQRGLAGFPLSITGVTAISTGTEQPEIGVKFTVNLNLLKLGSGSFSGSTTLSVIGEMGTDPNTQKFSFSRVEVNRIDVDAKVGPAVSVKGTVIFYRNDPKYGTGFYGKVMANILEKIQVDVVAQFGAVEPQGESKFRYGLIDFAAKFVPGIPLGVGAIQTGLSFYGGGGGLWFSMSRDPSSPSPKLPLESSADPSKAKIGESLSGYIYQPNNNTLFGARLMLTLGATKPEVFNGDIALEIEITKDWGLGRISLQGNGYGMTSKFPNRSDAKLTTFIDLTYTPPTKTFEGTFNAKLQYPPLITAEANIRLHASPEKWYVRFGTPRKVAGDESQPGPMNITLLNFMTVQGYFMFGSEIPAMPEIPSNIMAGLDRNGIKYTSGRDNMRITEGKGLAFGLKAGFETGRREFLIFYGDISAEAGFDASVMQYPASANCQGTSPIGINGWYGNFQMYAGLDADIGISVKLFFKRVSVSIFRAQAYAVLEAGGPSPTWAKGAVAGQYSVLSGLIKGSFKFEFEVGEQCAPMRDELADIKMISDITPRAGENDVSVMAAPRAAFNLALNTEMELGDGVTLDRYRMVLDYMKLEQKMGSGYVVAKGTKDIAGDRITVRFVAEDMLEANTEYRASVRVKMMKLVNGQWQDAYYDGKPMMEDTTITFTSGERPPFIPTANVAYTTPETNQRFFIQDWECRTDVLNFAIAAIRLRQGQEYLFDTAYWKRTAPKAASTKITGLVHTRYGTWKYPASYDKARKEVIMRSDQYGHYLDPRASVTIELIREDFYAGSTGTIATTEQKELSRDMGANSATTTTRQMSGATTRDYLITTKLASFGFTTSGHRNYKSKLGGCSLRVVQELPYATKLAITNPEGFDRHEIGAERYEFFVDGEKVFSEPIVQILPDEEQIKKTEWWKHQVQGAMEGGEYGHTISPIARDGFKHQRLIGLDNGGVISDGKEVLFSFDYAFWYLYQMKANLDANRQIIDEGWNRNVWRHHGYGPRPYDFGWNNDGGYSDHETHYIPFYYGRSNGGGNIYSREQVSYGVLIKHRCSGATKWFPWERVVDSPKAWPAGDAPYPVTIGHPLN